MPNYVTTRCQVSGIDAEIKAFRKRAFKRRGKETIFDFNAFIPMPGVLRRTSSGSVAEKGAALLSLLKGRTLQIGPITLRPRFAKAGRDLVIPLREELGMHEEGEFEVIKAWFAKHPEYRKEGRKRLAALVQTGYASWYEWSCDHWNTKWNACHLTIHSKRPFEFSFDTAWDFPIPVFEKIAREFPSLNFRCTSYDEGDGFAADGYFNPQRGQLKFSICEATDELYEIVYDEPRPEE